MCHFDTSGTVWQETGKGRAKGRYNRLILQFPQRQMEFGPDMGRRFQSQQISALSLHFQSFSRKSADNISSRNMNQNVASSRISEVRES